MGCDGGTIPKRHELVKGPKKVEKVSDMGRAGAGVMGVPWERGEVVGTTSGVPDVAALVFQFGESKINSSINNEPLWNASFCHLPGSTLNSVSHANLTTVLWVHSIIILTFQTWELRVKRIKLQS